MSAYPHPLVVAVAGGVVDGGKYQGDAELFAAAWQIYEAKRAAVDKEAAGLIGHLAEGGTLDTAAAQLANAAPADAARVAKIVVISLRKDLAAVLRYDTRPGISDELADELTQRLTAIGRTTSNKRVVKNALWKTVGNLRAATWPTSPVVASRPGEALETQAQRLAKNFIGHADAPEVLTLSGYLGGVIKVDDMEWQFFYLGQTLQLWLLIQPSDIVSMARVLDDKQPFGCKPDTIWVKGYTPVIHSDGKLTEQAIEARIRTRDLTTVAIAIDVLSRSTNAAPANAFGEEILGLGFSRFGWCP